LRRASPPAVPRPGQRFEPVRERIGPGQAKRRHGTGTSRHGGSARPARRSLPPSNTQGRPTPNDPAPPPADSSKPGSTRRKTRSGHAPPASLPTHAISQTQPDPARPSRAAADRIAPEERPNRSTNFKRLDPAHNRRKSASSAAVHGRP
jgi:hypothetical protein